MKLTQQEKMFLTNLKTQEQLCVDKYKYYSAQAKDGELKSLFKLIQKHEQTHFNALDELLTNKIPKDAASSSGSNDYDPKATYNAADTLNKKHDQFLCSDSITTEKYVAGAYNDDLFHFNSSEVRQVLGEIQIDEQRHAELINKYKTVNAMV